MSNVTVHEKRTFQTALELRDFLNTMGDAYLSRIYLDRESSNETGMTVELIEEKISTGVYHAIEFK